MNKWTFENSQELMKQWNLFKGTYQEFVEDDNYKYYNFKNGEVLRNMINKLRKRYGLPFIKPSKKELADDEIIKESVKLAKQKQRFMDSNRVERKTFREYARVENCIESLNREVVKILGEQNLSKFTQKHKGLKKDKKSPVGIIHSTDQHFNELINIYINKYDFIVGSKRSRKHILKSIKDFKREGVKEVWFINTGDIVNSDRRLDEKINMATNRMSAALLSVYIIQQMLIELNKHFNVKVVFVSGNESRLSEEFGWSNCIVKDNYDFMIYNVLEQLFKGSKGIEFKSGNFDEEIVNIHNKNFLIKHGIDVKTNTEQSIQSAIGKYTSRNIIIYYAFFGHLHSCRIGDTYSRGSSLAGGNDYSDKGLGLISRASQNSYIVYENGDIDCKRYDLQNTDNVEGYDIIAELEKYNAKSLKKIQKNQPIFKVII